ncbi:methyl-accepting chemotaxis protein [Pantoea stewartii]|uniref:methyl-accepting chemotaxis protein n=1 Tax=Pantoea stewartii TaxID=66269 RepID=UPI001626CD18|nr:methyl-accepting chemotaxis protein [Pantoea stewartii]MBC0856451.1 Tar ligand binding domain-containing protein [Pantoea stewartii]
MLNKIRTATLVSGVIIIFTVLQFITGGFYLFTSNSNNQSLSAITNSNTKVALLTNTWFAMNAVRSNINRTVIWLQEDGASSERATATITSANDEMKKTRDWFTQFKNSGDIEGLDKNLTISLDKSYEQFYQKLEQLITVAKERNASKLLSYNLEPSFQQMLVSYDAWRSAANDISRKAYAKNQHVFYVMLTTLSCMGVLIFLIVFISWQALRNNLIIPLNKSLQFIDSIKAGNLSGKLDTKMVSKTEMNLLAIGLMEMQTSLYATVKSVRTSSEVILAEINQLVDGNNDLSSRTEQQAASLEETAASMEQITQTVARNSENATDAASMATLAAQTAEKGGLVVNDVKDTVSDIEASSNKISDVTNLIQSIAFQTNILALNAAVEAARAGESGRGFAVVAGEVRNLAQRCSEAAKDVDMLIRESTDRVDKSSSLAIDATQSINRVVDSAVNLRDVINEISLASQEQSIGIKQVGVAVNELDKLTQLNYNLVQKSSHSCTELKEQVSLLCETVRHFNLEQQAF